MKRSALPRPSLFVVHFQWILVVLSTLSPTVVAVLGLSSNTTKTEPVVPKSRELKQAKSIKVNDVLFQQSSPNKSSKNAKSSKSRNNSTPTPAPVPAPSVNLCKGFVCEEGYSLRSSPDSSGGVADRATCCIRDSVCDGAGVGSPCSLGDIESSLIPNPSFEDHLCCPSDIQQLHCADTWIQATKGTSDYFIEAPTCGEGWWRNGYGSQLGSMPQGASDGDAFVGCIKMLDGSYYEYVGACLTSPLRTGTEYTFSFEVASAMDNKKYGGNTSGTSELLCIPSCDDFDNLTDVSDYQGDTYEVLATASPKDGLVGGGEWKPITFVTTPTTQDCHAIMVGPGLNMTVQSDQVGAYVLYDFLNIQEGEHGVCNSAGECVAQS